MNQKINSTLTLLGLSELEITIFLNLLQLGSTPASILARRLKINRSTTRYTLENLCKKRFAFQQDRNGTFYFSAEDPDKILLLLQEQQAEIKTKEIAVSQIIGDLKNLKNPHVRIPKVRFFEGLDGLIKMYEDVLEDSEKNNCTIYGYAQVDYKNYHPGVWEYLRDVYVPRRAKIGNKSFMIFGSDANNLEYLKNDKKMNRISLVAPTEHFSFQTCFQIYGDKLAFYSRQKDETPNGVIIQQDQIRQDQFTLFRMAWEYTKQLPINNAHQSITL